MRSVLAIACIFLALSTVNSQDLVREFFAGLHIGTGHQIWNVQIINQIDTNRFSPYRIAQCFQLLTAAYPREREQGVQCFGTFFQEFASTYYAILARDTTFSSVLNYLLTVFRNTQDFQVRADILSRQTGRNAYLEFQQAFAQQDGRRTGAAFGQTTLALYNSKGPRAGFSSYVTEENEEENTEDQF